MPEQKAGPAPFTTTARTSRLASSVSKRSRSEARRAAFMALRCPGRLRVTVATPASMAQRTSSDMTDLLGRVDHGPPHLCPLTFAPLTFAPLTLPSPPLEEREFGRARVRGWPRARGRAVAQDRD